jgi:hypothetical protein
MLLPLHSRLTGRDRERIANVPDLLGFLYRWMQSGDEEPAKAWIAEELQSDTGLLRLLDNIRSWRASSTGVTYPLKRSDIQQLTDVTPVEERLKRIEADPEAPPEMRGKATELLAALTNSAG